METDSFFCQLLKQLPQTLFELLDQPSEQALAYRFDSVETKKSLRNLQDIRKSKVWQEAHETGIGKGIEKGKTLTQLDVIRNCLANGMSAKEIAAILKITPARVRRLIKQAAQ